jgi:2-iminobutanoate/2-iminopropanoate deaminase
VLVSGQVPFDGAVVSDDFRTQAVQVFENLGRCLRAAGCDYRDLLKVNGFVADLADFATYNEVYREYIPEPYPARTTVRADLVGVRVEVEALARRPRS